MYYEGDSNNMFAWFLLNYSDNAFIRRVRECANRAKIVLTVPTQETFQPPLLPDGVHIDRSVIDACVRLYANLIGVPLDQLMTTITFVMVSTKTWS